MQILKCIDNTHKQTEVKESSLVVVASIWAIFYLVMIVSAISGQTLGRSVELIARN